MKTLNIVEKYTDTHTQINEIVEHNGSKFKIVAILTKGGVNQLYAEKMDSDGVFHFVFDMFDIDFEYTTSYAMDTDMKQTDLKVGINKMKSLIKKVY